MTLSASLKVSKSVLFASVTKSTCQKVEALEQGNFPPDAPYLFSASLYGVGL